MKSARLVLISFMLLSLFACNLPADNLFRITPAESMTPAVPPRPVLTDTPGLHQSVENGVEISLREVTSTRYNAEIDVGGVAHIEIAFIPLILTVQRRSDGSLLSTSGRAWDAHPVQEMRFCIALGKPCELPASWQPFQGVVSQDLKIDWLGARTVELVAQFREASGRLIPAFRRGYADLAEVARSSFELVGIINEKTPQDKQPGFVQTAVAGTRAAFPVTGSVLIEDGRCCAGGVAGSSINLNVAFKAASPLAEVTEMRLVSGGGCRTGAGSLDATWEKFGIQKTFTTRLALNWVGFYVNVQYRDARGNLSPVYCDDISLEGMPQPPTIVK